MGLSFLLSGYIALCFQPATDTSAAVGIFTVREDSVLGKWILRVALLSFETVVPCEILVLVVVTHVLWPEAVRLPGTNSYNLRSFSSLMMHNFNTVAVLTEVALLDGLPITAAHLAVTPIFGLIYTVFVRIYHSLRT